MVTTHGLSKSAEYQVWVSMNARCSNPKKEVYKYYGGRGIKVCEEWSKNFESFYLDMGPRPTKNHSIDRINNDLGYSKNNCRWATDKEQAVNTSKNNHVTAFGKTLCIVEWSELTGIKQSTISKRINKYKWSPEKALSSKQTLEKNFVRNLPLTFLEETKTVSEWANCRGINVLTLIARLNYLHWDVEKALSTEVKNEALKLTAFGETLTVVDWAKKIDVEVSTIYKRLRILKWPVEKALSSPKTTRKVTAFGETLTISEWAIKTGLKSKIIVDRIDKLSWDIEKALLTKKR